MKQVAKDKLVSFGEKFETIEYETMLKDKILKYLKSWEIFAVAGMVHDCVTGERLKIENVGYNDGQYVWSEQDIYHIEKYNAAVTEEFLNIFK